MTFLQITPSITTATPQIEIIGGYLISALLGVVGALVSIFWLKEKQTKEFISEIIESRKTMFLIIEKVTDCLTRSNTLLINLDTTLEQINTNRNVISELKEILKHVIEHYEKSTKII